MCNRNHLRYKLILSISLSTSSLSESAKFEQRTDTNFRDAEQGNVDAQLNLGNMYMQGLGVTQDGTDKLTYGDGLGYHKDWY